jgi:hypothetical protein
MQVTKWPFRFVVDARGRSVGWVAVNARVVTPERHEELALLRHMGYRFLGVSSDGTFPLGTESDALDYGALCEAWCHCFREPDRHLPLHLPRALISESDFTDFRRVSADVAGKRAMPLRAEFDFVYLGATEPWKKAAKHWELARPCILRICTRLGLRGLLVATEQFPVVADVTVLPWLPWDDFLAHLARARFLFVPNECDASPRVLAEAMCLNVPVVVYQRILGGWKYVNPFTGVFFDSEDDVVAAVRRCLEMRPRPRSWFRANYGPYLAGQRLLALVRSVDASITERSHLGLAQHIDDRWSAAL